jgi:hypothetical protein
MKEEPVSDALLRQFLLGQVDDQERQRLESMFVTGALSEERVMAAEQHLIDDYLDDSLTPVDRQRFLAQYGETPAEQRKLRIAKSIHDWPATSEEAPRVVPAVESRWSRLRARFRLKSAFVIPIAAAAMIAIIFGAVLLNRWLEQRYRHQAMEQELARLNAPSRSGEISPSTPLLTLRPGTVRSAEAENELTPPANAEFIELRLLWTQKERFPSYQATIRRVDEQERYTAGHLQIDNGSNAIRLRLPRHYLTRGLYQIEISGVATDGATGPAEEYQFQVR